MSDYAMVVGQCVIVLMVFYVFGKLGLDRDVIMVSCVRCQ